MFTSKSWRTENEAGVGLRLEIEGEMGVYRGGVKPCVHVHNHMYSRGGMGVCSPRKF